MNDIEKMIADTMNDVGRAGQSLGKTSAETFKYTLKYFKEFKHIGKKNLRMRLALLLLVLGTMAAIWVFAPNIATFLVEKLKTTQLGKNPFLLRMAGFTKVYQMVAVVLVPYMYLMAVGSKKYEEANQFTDKFELIGMVKQLNKTIVDEYGNKKRISITPELIGSHKPNENITVRLFLTNGQPLQVWEAKRADLEAAFDEALYQLSNSGDNINVVKMVTVSPAYKAELDEKYKKEMEYDAVFEKIGLVGKGTREINHFGKRESIKNYPQYLETKYEEINGKTFEILKFRSTGTELSNWQAVKFLMENVLNKIVVKIEQAKKDKQLYMVYTLDLKDDLEELYSWSDDFIDPDDGVLVLGEGLLGRVKIDLNNLPHILIGGVTGFGKSVLSNCLTWQLIKKGTVIIPLDFKGGIELDMFSPFHEVISERDKAVKALEAVVKEYEERLKLIKSRKLKNIKQFNAKYPDEALCRMVIIGDEVAEMLSGATSKVDQVLISKLDEQVSTVARLARAVGIHLILGTQRPDANVLQGQIKNNLPARICGRMIDIQPSIMILGTPDATRIPDIKGRFMLSLGADIEIFQSYYFKDTDIKPGNYVKGQCLVYDLQNGNKDSTKSSRKSTSRRVSLEEDFEPLVLDPTEANVVDDAWLIDQIGEPKEDFEEDEEDSEDSYAFEEEGEGDLDEDSDEHSSNDSCAAGGDEHQSQSKRRVEIL